MMPPAPSFLPTAVLLLSLPALLTPAPTAPQLLERLRLTAVTASLDSPGSLPFHLKVTIQLDTQYHHPAEQGTVEFWSAPDAQRIVYDFPSYRATFLQTPAGKYQTENAAPPPYLAKYLIDQLLHPVPQSFDPAQIKATFAKRFFGKPELDCITLTANETKPPNPNPAPTVTYCLDPSTSDLRLTFDVAGQSTTREAIGTFRDRRPSLRLSTAFTGKPVAHLHVDQLNGQTTPFPQTSETAGLVLNPDQPAYLPGQVIAGSIRTKEVPVYPITARQDHISGSVLLHAIIGVDGRIKDLQLIGSPDDSLTQSAMNAVKNWTYAPYLLNGKPTEVDTTITVNFSFGPRP